MGLKIFLKNGLRWVIDNGRAVDFWKYKCVYAWPLINFIAVNDRLQECLVVTLLISILTYAICWGFSTSCKFTVKSATLQNIPVKLMNWICSRKLILVCKFLCGL